MPIIDNRQDFHYMGILTELFLLFLKLGAFTIGGGVAMIPLLQHSLTEDKKWFSTEEIVDIIAVCQSLPGVIAINMATYVGYKKKGFIGSVVATVGVTLPSFVMILLIAAFISNLGDNPVVNGAMAGLRAAALGLVLVAIIQMSSVVFKGLYQVALALLAFVLIAVFNINTAYVILLCMIIGIASIAIGEKDKAELSSAEKSEQSVPESDPEDDLKGGAS